MAITINGTTGISGVDGSAATPALQGADTNTGISFGTDTVTINTGGVARVTTDSSGNVGIGTSSPSSALYVKRTLSNSGIYTDYNSTNVGRLEAASNGNLYIGTTVGSGSVFLGNTANASAVSLDSSGNLLVGTTGTAGSVGSGIAIRPTIGGSVGNIDIGHGSAAGTGNSYVQFYWNGGVIGTITQSGTTAVAYNTSSDYRLKEQVTPMTGALAKNELLNPVTYKWKTDGSDGQGFIAHELQAVFPDAVTGEKDAVDAEGKPVYQGVDTSFLVGHLVACVKELTAELDSVKAELATLKGAA